VPPTGTVDTDVTLYENNIELPGTQYPYDSHKLPPETTTRYLYDRYSDALGIRYELPYLSLLAKGGPIEPLNEFGLIWWFPKLSIKIVNNTSRTLFLTETAIEVLSSEVNREPVLVIHNEDHMDGGKSYDQMLGGFYITNEGWGDIRDAVVEYRLLSNKSGGRLDLNGSKGLIQIGTFSERASVEVVSNPPKPFEDCKDGSKSIDVIGALKYKTESQANRATWFRVTVPLNYCGGPQGPSIVSSQYDVLLDSEKSGYVKRVPIAQELKPGETDHFLIQLGTDKSAKFDLIVSLLAAGRVEIPKKRISIDIFVRRPAAYYANETRRQSR